MADYSAALRDWDKPESQDYCAWPNDVMTLATLRANKDFLVARLYYWNDIYWQSGNTAKSNISKLDGQLRTKLSAYEAAILKKMEEMLDQANVVAPNGGTWVDPAPTVVGSGTTTINPADTINTPIVSNPAIVPGSANTTNTPAATTPATTNPVTKATAAVVQSVNSNKKSWIIAGVVAAVLITTAIIIKRSRN